MSEQSGESTEYDELVLEFHRIEREEVLRRKQFTDNQHRLQENWDKLVKVKHHINHVKAAIEEVTLEEIGEEAEAVGSLEDDYSTLSVSSASRAADMGSIREKMRYKDTMKRHIALVEERLLSVRTDMTARADDLSQLNEQLDLSARTSPEVSDCLCFASISTLADVTVI
jgi:hypothetical protein